MKQYHKISQPFNCLDFIESYQPKVFSFIDNNKGDFIFGWDKDYDLFLNTFNLEKFNQFEDKHQKDYIFGYVGYDAKNELLPNCSSKNKDIHQFPDSVFFTCKHVVIKRENELLYYGTNQNYALFLKLSTFSVPKNDNQTQVDLDSSIKKQDYIQNVELLKSKIQNGDIYEANYCIQFYKKDTEVDGLQTYLKLRKNTKAPFSTYFKYNHIEVMSASPERFYKKDKLTILSQPIKGTAPRGNNEEDDKINKISLKNNPKEISENIMIVDLVRNDMSKLPNVKSVKTLELCKLYSFDTVHQLISTVKAEVKEDINASYIFKNLFPMGSMTGAPKISACQIIDEIESFKRSVYSGTIGYISPNNHQDFNVVIRSVLYNSNNKTVSVSVGGAITIKSVPEMEYDECLLKLKAISQSIIKKSNK